MAKYLTPVRQPRNQATEEGFLAGMVEVDTPLDASQVKTLINCIPQTPQSGALRPRWGLYTDEVYDPGVSGYNNIVSAHEVNAPNNDNHILTLVTNDAGEAKLFDLNRDSPGTTVYADLRDQDIFVNLNSDPAPDYAHPSETEDHTMAYHESHEEQAIPPHERRNSIIKGQHKNTINIQNPRISETQEWNMHGFKMPGGTKTIPNTIWDNTVYWLNSSGPVLRKTDWDKDNACYKEYLKDASKPEAAGVVPFEPTIAEAVSVGFNMLHNKPYTAYSRQTAVGSVVVDGVLLIDPNATEEESGFISSPTATQTVDIVLYAAGLGKGKKYKVKWEWQPEGSSDWTLYRTDNVTIAANADDLDLRDSSGKHLALRNFTIPGSDFYIKVSVYKFKDDVAELSSTAFTASKPESGLDYTTWVAEQCDSEGYYLIGDCTAAYGFTVAAPGSAKPEVSPEFKLNTATNLVYWNRRLCVWGITEASNTKAPSANTIFCSAVDRDDWFPYPLCAATFDSPVVNAIPHGDDLAVFTEDALYLLTNQPDGYGFIQKLVQKNFNFKTAESHLACSMKNMLFFKSDNYYYMMVPKTNAAVSGTQQIAPISQNIKHLFDKFSGDDGWMMNILNELYDYNEGPDYRYQREFGNTVPGTLGDNTHNHIYNRVRLDSTQSYISRDAIHVMYTFQNEDAQDINRDEFSPGDKLIHLDLQYDTVLRAWSAHLLETQHPLKVFKQNAVGEVEHLCTFNRQGFRAIETETELNRIDFDGIQVLKLTDQYCKDFYLMDINSASLGGYTVYDPYDVHSEYALIKNWQLIDTGFRRMGDTNGMYKRFREVQIKMINHSMQSLWAHHEFVLDGENRTNFRGYSVDMNPVPESDGYCRMTVMPYLCEPMMIPGSTALAGNQPGFKHWTGKAEETWWRMDLSGFPEQRFWKGRIKVSGKGILPRLKLMIHSEEPFEILGYTWVFRVMNSRG